MSILDNVADVSTSHLASGATGLMYWNWHSIHNGYETYWRGLLSHDLQTNPTCEEAGIVGREWQRLGNERLCIKKHNSVALVVDNQTLTAFKWFPIDRDLSYNDVVRWMYGSLYEMNIECDVVHAKELRTEKYNVIITPALYCVDEALTLSLRSFVEHGGILISSFKSFVADMQATVYSDTQPHNLTECFGMSYNQFTEPGKTKVCGEPVRYFAELIKPQGAEILEKYEHPYWNAYAAITRNTFGNGAAYYIGCFTSKQRLKNLYKEAFKSVPDINTGSCTWPLIVKTGINSSGKIMHYVLHYSEACTAWTCPYQSVRDNLSGNCYQKGDCISLKDWDVLILEERS